MEGEARAKLTIGGIAERPPRAERPPTDPATAIASTLDDRIASLCDGKIAAATELQARRRCAVVARARRDVSGWRVCRPRQMAMTAKDEDVRLGFGADDNVKIVRSTVQQIEGSAGIITPSKPNAGNSKPRFATAMMRRSGSSSRITSR